MTILPCSCWPLVEHAIFGQNGFDASLGSVFVCINDSMPMDACFFKPPCSFHRSVESYQKRRETPTVKGNEKPTRSHKAHSLMQVQVSLTIELAASASI